MVLVFITFAPAALPSSAGTLPICFSFCFSVATILDPCFAFTVIALASYFFCGFAFTTFGWNNGLSGFKKKLAGVIG